MWALNWAETVIHLIEIGSAGSSSSGRFGSWDRLSKEIRLRPQFPEVLYDIDKEAQEKARELGLTLRRTESLNTDPELLEGLADEILRAATL